MIGETLSITYDGTAIVLERINQDNFGSLYRKRVSNVEYDLAIRHNTSGGAKGSTPNESHNVEFTRTVFDVATGVGVSVRSYTVLKALRGSDTAVMEKVQNTLVGTLTPSLVTKIVGWQS